MSEQNSFDIKKAYKFAIPLSKAVFEFANSKLRENYRGIAIEQPKFKASSFLGIMNEGLQAFQAVGSAQSQRNLILTDIQSDIAAQIQNGELMALGLELPISAESKPTQIAAHLFSGEINWDNAELIFKNLEYSGIRLLKTETEENQASQNPKLKTKLNSEKPQKLNFADLDPDLYIDENKAAEILGISPRTLQGYRVKGGGPEFVKIGKAVRYKLLTIKEWIEKNRHTNTIN